MPISDCGQRGVRTCDCRDLIPPHLVNRLAKEHGVDKKSRTFTPWSHVVTLIYAHLAHAISLNDVCDALQMNNGALATIRGATPPTRNNLSHADKVRDAAMAKELYWAVIDCLGKRRGKYPGTASSRQYLIS